MTTKITIAGITIPLNAIERYVKHLQLQNIGSIGDPQEYEWMRARLHNNIFIVAGFKDGKSGIPARVIHRDTLFGEGVSDLITTALACPKAGHGTTDRKGFCFHCGKFITATESLRTLRKIAAEQRKTTK